MKKKIREANRHKSFDGGSSNGRLDIQDNPRIKMRFSSQVHSNFPKARDNRVSNPMFQKETGTS